MNNVKTTAADCSRCFLRKGEYCTQLQNIPCSDFKPLPIISGRDNESWPDQTEFSYLRKYAGISGLGRGLK